LAAGELPSTAGRAMGAAALHQPDAKHKGSSLSTSSSVRPVPLQLVAMPLVLLPRRLHCTAVVCAGLQYYSQKLHTAALVSTFTLMPLQAGAP
jgi:hypothetical protein